MNDVGDVMWNYFGGGKGFGGVALFFTFSVLLFLVYFVEGIVWEVWFKGWFVM